MSAAYGARRRFLQIDLIKGMAVVAVVLTHSLVPEQLVEGWAVFHIWQAVPVFVVLMGLNAGLSFRGGRLPSGTRALGRYWRVRALRLLVPFAVAWLLSLLLGLSRGSVHFGVESPALLVPYPGPGNYFVPVALGFSLLAPPLFAAFRRAPAVVIAGCFGLDLAFELWAATAEVFAAHPYLYSASFPRYMAAFALGMWLSDALARPRFRATPLALLAGAGAFYLCVANSGDLATPFRPDWGTQNLLAVGYPAALVLAGLVLLPPAARSWPLIVLARFGRWSYQLFLGQMLWFAWRRQGRPGQIWGDLLALAAVAACVYLWERWRSTRWAREGGAHDVGERR